MPGPVPARCNFTEDFLQDARDAVRRRTVAVQVVQRCRLVLLLHEQPGVSNEDAAQAVGLSSRQVQRWRSRWVSGDFSVEDHTWLLETAVESIHPGGGRFYRACAAS